MTDNQEQLIKEAVEKALQGDMDAVNNIEDRVTRSKAKAALVKAKREAAKTSAEPSTKEKSEESGSESKSVPRSPNQQFAGIIASQFPKTVDEELSSETHIQLQSEKWLDIAQYLRDDPVCLFDSLQCITGVDLGEDVGLEVRYNLHSMTHRHVIEIRIACLGKNPKIPSVEAVWRIGDWFERETYDMFGIEFQGNRDLRRILLPDDWECWPLRKDYEVQVTYHGIMGPKVKEGWE